MDNDPKHTSKSTSRFMLLNTINHLPTTPESPDLIPIEMLWIDTELGTCGINLPSTSKIQVVLCFFSSKSTSTSNWGIYFYQVKVQIRRKYFPITF